MSLLSLLGIQDAVAQNVPAVNQAATTATETAHAAPSAGTGFMSMIWMLVAFFAIFYFLLIRPQSKRAKDHRKLIDGLTAGDEVITTAGLLGKVVKISDDFVVLNVAENVDMTFQKNAIATVLPKGTVKTVK